MALLPNINVGTSPNDGTGDSIRNAFTIVNENFQFIEAFFPNSSVSNLVANITSTGISTFEQINANVINANTIGNTAANITSTGISTFEQLNANVINVQTLGNAGTLITGNIVTAAQPNITSLGNLTSLEAAGIVQFDGVFIANSDSNFISNMSVQGNTVITGGYNTTVSFTLSNVYYALESQYVIVANVSEFGNTTVILPNANVAVSRVYKVLFWDPDNSVGPNAYVTVGSDTNGGNVFIAGNIQVGSIVLNYQDNKCELISIGDYWYRTV